MKFIAAAAALAAVALLISPVPQTTANASPYFWLPWASGDSRDVTQGNNQGTHTGVTKYAWDFDASGNNWLVRAARGGVVEAVQDGFTESQGGCASQYSDYTNYVKIDTEDGYETLYAHLQYGSVSGKVSVGQPVTLYTPIGNSDSTGYVCGGNPDHLHYQVQTPCSGAFCTSVSSSFLDPDVLQQRPDGIPRTNDTVVSGNHYPGPCDFNGIGYEGLATGVTWEGVNGETQAGAISAIYGATGGLTASGDQFLHQDTNPTWVDSNAEDDHVGGPP